MRPGSRQSQKPSRGVQVVYRSLDVFSSILLLTGQITIGGVFVGPHDFALSLSGPFTGSGAVGKTAQTNLVLDGLDIITALLLIVDQINVIGTYITANRFTIVVGGPPFGSDKIEAYVPTTQEFFRDFSRTVFDKHGGFLTRRD